MKTEGNSYATTVKQAEVSRAKSWSDWYDKIPFFSLPPGYSISVRPPIAMADARFIVKKPDGREISVYLDLHENLGCFGGPHWEVYPDKDGNNSRVMLEDTGALEKLIIEA